MAGGSESPDAKAFLESIESAEREAAEYAGVLKKLRTRLSRTRKALSTKPAVATQVAALVSDLQEIKMDPPRPVVSQLIESLDAQLRILQRRLQESFPPDLRQSCERAGLGFKPLPDGFGVGPFFVAIDAQRETASFQYAKVPILKDVPLNASAIVAQAASLKAALLDPPVDLPRFRAELHEAMRVALARRDNRFATTDLRVELPAVFREMGFVRQFAGTTSKRKPAVAEFSLARFVIELKQFIQSDRNVHADQQFRLEPAVIENTKNPKKSVFIPRDISCGFGEGTYYQAIVLQHP